MRLTQCAFSLVLMVVTSVIACGERPRSPNRPASAHQHQHSGPNDGGEQAAPLALHPERTVEIKPYQMPEPLRERVQQVRPQLVPPKTTAFDVAGQNLHINSKTGTMTFTGTLKIAGRQDERIELTCKFDKSKVPWSCTDMVPVLERIAKERRLQATVECVDVYRCDEVDLELFVVINGKVQSKLFQSGPFFVRRASSGDMEYEAPEEFGKPPEAETLREAPRVFEKPTQPDAPSTPPAQAQPSRPSAPTVNPPATPPRQFGPPSGEAAPEVQQAPTAQSPSADYNDDQLIESDLNEQELGEVMDDANAAAEFRPPAQLPNPTSGRFTIPGIERLRPTMNSSVPDQAVGAHNRGFLERAAELPDSGQGFMCRDRENRSYGTNLMIEMIKAAATSLEKSQPGKTPFVIANISKRTGGRLCGASGRCHSSHQTGLDVDIAYPSTRAHRDMWPVCQQTRFRRSVRLRNGETRDFSVTGCAPGSRIAEDFDEARFWTFIKSFTCAQNEPVIAMFVDTEIKKHLCRYARNLGEDVNNPSSCAHKTLRALKHEPGHHNHVHIRLKCPGNRRCREATVTLGSGTGC